MYFFLMLINCRFHLFWSSASSFSSQYLLLFLKSSKTLCSFSSYNFQLRYMYFFLMLVWQIVTSTSFDLQLPPLTPNIFFCFSNHLGAVLLLPMPFTSVICPSMVWRRRFLLRIWPIQLSFLRGILFRSVLFSPIGQELVH